jgi:hypothetical protein
MGLTNRRKADCPCSWTYFCRRSQDSATSTERPNAAVITVKNLTPMTEVLPLPAWYGAMREYVIGKGVDKTANGAKVPGLNNHLTGKRGSGNYQHERPVGSLRVNGSSVRE